MFLLKNLELGGLLPYLYQEKVISRHDEEEIVAEKSRPAKVNKLLLLLPTRGPQAFNKFLEGLKETEQDHVADQLEKWQPSDSVMTEEFFGNLSMVPNQQVQLVHLFMDMSKVLLLQK